MTWSQQPEGGVVSHAPVGGVSRHMGGGEDMSNGFYLR